MQISCFIAIVWPRGITYLDWIKNQLGTLGKVVYVKDFTLNNKGAYQFYKNAHRSFGDTKIHKALHHYFKNILPPYQCAAIVFDTTACVNEIQKLKEKIRSYIGQGYWSIHTVDNHQETIELGEWVFDEKIMRKLTH